MSQQNIKIVRQVYDAWNRREVPGPAALLDESIDYVNPSGAVEPGVRHGLAAFRRAVEKTLDGWEVWQMEPEEFRTRGDLVAVAVRYTARGRGSGLQVEGRESALWTIREGRVVRYAWFHEPLDAFQAAGLGD
jgi:ketosteroid isomerase-like protein